GAVAGAVGAEAEVLGGESRGILRQPGEKIAALIPDQALDRTRLWRVPELPPVLEGSWAFVGQELVTMTQPQKVAVARVQVVPALPGNDAAEKRIRFVSRLRHVDLKHAARINNVARRFQVRWLGGQGLLEPIARDGQFKIDRWISSGHQRVAA